MARVDELTAYSSATNTEYPNWDALVAAEAHGYIVTAILTRGSETWPWSSGLFPTKREAVNARARMRRTFRKEMDENGDNGRTKMSTFVRPLWKDQR